MSLLELLGCKAASLRNRVADHVMERRLNVRTNGRLPVDVPDAVPYSTFAYWSIQRVLDRLELGPDDVLADLGCGKGRVVCCAARRAVRQVIGVELDARLCEAARANAAGMRSRRAPIRIVHSPAQSFDYRGCTVLFMFNPFGPGTLKAVLQAVIDSRLADLRQVRVAYVNPRHDRVFEESGAFECYDHWRGRPTGRLKFDVSFWKAA